MIVEKPGSGAHYLFKVSADKLRVKFFDDRLGLPKGIHEITADTFQYLV